MSETNITVTHSDVAVDVSLAPVELPVTVNVVSTSEGAVTSVAGRGGAVVLTKADVGLSNVDNTADASKPVSTLQAAADAAVAATAASNLASGLAGKANSSHTHALADLTQSGATTGQIVQWNGAAWVPVTFSGGIGGTLGATDNALTRADGTGAATAQGSSVICSDAGGLSTGAWQITSGTYSSRDYTLFGAVGTNISVVLNPTGTGAISAHVANGAAGGGNNRGQYAVDLQMARSTAAQVASGNYSAVLGGLGSTASGAYAVAAGQGNTASGLNSVSFGYFGTASGSFSINLSAGGTASASFSTAFGYYPSSYNDGMIAHASGAFSAAGDAQSGQMVARASTTDATPTDLGLGLSGTSRISVPANSSGRARIIITARRATAGAETMTWTREVAWQRGVAASTTTVDVQTIGTDRGYSGGAWGAGPAWTIGITADTTNGAIKITGTGAAATNIRWVASIAWAEDTFA